ncbi:MAG: IS630 family transposase [Candidatus Binataceae bacterium]
MRVAPTITLTEEQQSELTSLARARSAQPARLVQRARVVLLAAQGLQNREIAQRVGASRYLVARWRERFLKRGVAGIEKDAPRPGRPTVIDRVKVREIVRVTTRERPAGATHWSQRTLAEATGVSPASVARIWKLHGLKPHRVRVFKLSNDPRFEEKLVDIVGLYLNPPKNALVLCVDEKSQIQALDRTQPSLPLKRGRAQTMTHDYKRHGTTTLFAALNALSGKVIGRCMKRHTHKEWLRFLKLIDRRTPTGMTIHLIEDNYGTHTHPAVKAWLAEHPRFVEHFTPTSASWLNMVERFFRDLTSKRVRRGSFHSVPDLEQAITDHITAHNHAPKPFIWTAKAADILEKVKRGRAALNKLQSA